ncbi:MAG: hypothetical protein ACPKM0_01750 [Pleomorphochaeta sp.]
MKINKIKKHTLEKCYAIANITYQNKEHIVVAAEKTDDCLLFDIDGNFIETIWKGPSGTMSIVPLEDADGCFLATKKMYSPNDSKEAEIVLVKHDETGWKTRTIATVPYAHRFDVLKTDDKRYLICATIKSNYEYRDDWRFPGQYLAVELPKVLDDTFVVEPQLIIPDLLKNHGYIHRNDANGDYSVIACENGVYEIHPPTKENSDWAVKKLIEDPTSDIAFVDYDEDGKEEMLSLAPFHGNTIRIYKLDSNNEYKLDYEFEDKHEFLHSIWAGTLYNKPYSIISNRKGQSRDLMGIFYSDNSYKMELLEKECGSTNVLVYYKDGKPKLVSTNREIDEIAFYDIEE